MLRLSGLSALRRPTRTATSSVASSWPSASRDPSDLPWERTGRHFYTRETDLGLLSIDGTVTVPLLYQHGWDSRYRSSPIGRAVLTLDEHGVWSEAEMWVRDTFDRWLYDSVEAGHMGLSSGAVGKPYGTSDHFGGRRVQCGQWVIGELSLTPFPTEFRTCQDLMSRYYAPYPRGVETESVVPQGDAQNRNAR